MWETWVWFLGWEDPLEEGMATHSSILAWRILLLHSLWGCKELGAIEWLFTLLIYSLFVYIGIDSDRIEWLSLYLFIQSFGYTSIDLWIFIYTVGYNTVLLYVFGCSDCFSFDHWELFCLTPVSLSQAPRIVLIWAHLVRCSRLSLYISHPSLRISRFFKETCFIFYWRMTPETKVWVWGVFTAPGVSFL